MGLILDIVPNHMATDDANRYWADPELRRAFFDLDPETGRHRRFFDIDHLAGVRQEDPEVFAETHRLALALVREGAVDGLRIDHPDGLADPAGYLRAAARRRRRARVGREDPRPRRAAARLAGRGHGRLRVPQRRRGAVRRPGGRGAADRAVGGGVRRRAAVRRLDADEAKLEQARTTVRARGRAAAARCGPSVDGLERGARRRCRSTAPTSRDGRGRAEDREVLARGRALDAGCAERAAGVRHALPADDAAGDGQGRRGHRVLPLRAAARAQRRRRRPGPLRRSRSTRSTPATASAPSASRATCSSRRRTTPSARATCARGSARWPAMAEEWAAHVRRWLELLRAAARGARPTPSRATSIFQTLVGAWPIEPERLEAYMEKAMREAKRNTNWIEPGRGARGGACKAFCRGAATTHEPFLRRLRAVRRARSPRAGERAALGQLLLKLTVPGRARHLPGRRAALALARRPRQPPAGRLGRAPRGARRAAPTAPSRTARRASCW